MHRTEYLATASVNDFIDWLANNLHHESLFAHSYFDRHRKETVAFAGLEDACGKYYWKHRGTFGVPAGDDLDSSHAALSALRGALRIAITSDDASAPLEASTKVMAWGGVRAGNVRWLTAQSTRLTQILKTTAAALASDDLAHPLLANRGQLRFNAGMTKIYSLLVDDFIIYDSRVAAALGWIVVKYCQYRNLSAVPGELAFPWAPAKEGSDAKAPKNRNPRTGRYHFPRLIAGEHHAVWNLRASWILAQVLTRVPASAFKRDSAIPGLRCLEAALFMIGYDLPANGDIQDAQSLLQPHGAGEWLECYTAARGKRFHYRIDADGIHLEDGRHFSVNVINAMLNNLQRRFSTGQFPLANSATQVGAGKSRQGVGSAYFEATGQKGNPPDTSALAAVLHELGALAYTPGSREPWSIDFSAFASPTSIDISSLFAREAELELML
ncbi:MULTISPECIES: hypothetical protein [Pseudomonas]|uniref:hypothetical protein n=1 Tax=Pseudomonas TaxID=286 RepID=UPI002555839C|nr:hypothetical protein [Pseudomonas sp. FR229a]WPC27233.1 hypothetical protein OE648_21830 [Pseudomonas moraviensis]